MSGPAVDRDQIGLFIRVIFRNVGEGGRVSLRNFYDDEAARKGGDKPPRIRNTKLNGSGLEPLVSDAVEVAEEAAHATRPVVFAPPICTFNGNKAGWPELREGLTISAELDTAPSKGLAIGRGALGPPTLVIASGGEWTDPDTGEIEPKLHAHWLLSEPTRTPEEHEQLRRARELLCNLAGGDPSSISPVHPMRWAGSIHRKNPDAPKLCRIVEANPDIEIALEHALDELEGLAALRKWTLGQKPRAAEDLPGGADDDLLAAIADSLTNPLPPKEERGKPRDEWDDWNRIGLRFFAASDGSEAGFEAFDAFSRKNTKKYDADATRARWEHYRTSPPTRTGVGALVVEARRCDPTFRARKPEKPGAPREEGRDAKPGQDWGTDLGPAVERMNARYFVAQTGGRGVIASLARDDDLGRERLVFSREQDIRLLYRNRRVVVGATAKGTEISKDLGAAWLEHRDRRTYDRIALIPKGPTPPGVYNLWRGFGLEPARGDWPRFREHLLEVVCGGNRTYYDYLIGWCAYCVQHPERPTEVAVVLRGLKGCGKGTVAQVLVDIFRDHALHIAHSKYLIGTFNAHLVDALFLYLDEAIWAGDKQGEGVLKALITERTLMIEPKGVDSFMVPNRLKIMMASNADWVVPATADERRFFVLDVSDKKRDDRPYFKELYAALDGGERGAFLHHLLTLDLSKVEIRDVPHTGALNRQKLTGADSVTQFWHDCLREGAIIGIGDDAGDDQEGWPKSIVAQLLHASYVDHAREHGERHPATDARMAERLQELWKGCGVRRIRPHEPWGNIKRPHRYALGPLEKHREAFLEAMNIEGHEWPVVDEEGSDAGR